jgi:hypothetical protein
MDKFIEKLKNALNQSCDDAFFFLDDETSLIDAEYLLTVNAAKSIRELNNYFGSPYKIYIEHSTEKFSTSCPPLTARVQENNFMGYKKILRNGIFDTKRPGKIDVAVYTSQEISEKPHCAIEFKGFNPQKVKIIEDLERNLEYFSFKANTGLSELPFSFFAALHSYKKTFSDKKETSNLKRIERRYKNYLSSLSIPNSVTSNIEVFTIRRGLVPNPNDPDVQMHGLQGDEDYHFIGTIISFRQ